MKSKVIKINMIMAFVVVSVLVMNMTVYAKSSDDNSSLDKMTKEERNQYVEEVVEEKQKEKRQTKNYKHQKEFLESAQSLNAFDGKTKEEIEEYLSYVYTGRDEDNTSSYGLITSPLEYLHNNVGKTTDSYSVTSKTLSQVGRKKCSEFSGKENCTLTAVLNIMCYYRTKGYSKIPSTNAILYSRIKKQANDLGYDGSTNNGFPVTKNNNLVKNTWRKGFGYSDGNASNNYLWEMYDITNSIKNGNPVLFSLASGVYYNHSITVYGYKTYKNKRTGRSYVFLIVADGWSSDARYLAWTNTGESYAACMTKITPPSSK